MFSYGFFAYRQAPRYGDVTQLPEESDERTPRYKSA
jgi:hypothetical protein